MPLGKAKITVFNSSREYRHVTLINECIIHTYDGKEVNREKN